MFIVRWLPNALNQLAGLNQPDDGKSVTRAIDRIHERLQGNPFAESESRDGKDRLLLEAPFGALIRIDENKRIVFVLKVWRFQK